LVEFNMQEITTIDHHLKGAVSLCVRVTELVVTEDGDPYPGYGQPIAIQGTTADHRCTFDDDIERVHALLRRVEARVQELHGTRHGCRHACVFRTHRCVDTAFGITRLHRARVPIVRND